MGPSEHETPYDLLQDLKTSIEKDIQKGTLNNKLHKTKSPRLVISINTTLFSALIDSGSQITCVSEEFYNHIKTQIKVIEFPVSNVHVQVAIGKKTATVKKQILVDLVVGDKTIPTCFLAIPHLTSSIIIGNDWLTLNKSIINYEDFLMTIAGYKIPEKLIKFDKIISERVITVEQNDSIMIHIITYTDTKLFKVPDQHYNTSSNPDTDNKKSNLNQTYLSPVLDNENIEDETINLFNMRIAETDDLMDNNYFINLKNLINDLNNLTTKQKQIFFEMMSKFERLFTYKKEPAGTYEHKINLTKGNEKTIVRKSYPVPFAMRESVKKEIGKMLQDGIIERSNSPYCNPLRIVKKNNGKIRICLDMKYINSIIEGDNESPPRINELMQQFYGVDFISKSDLTNGYWQVPLERNSRKYTAFLHEGELYQFCRVPFGLKNAGAGFMKSLRTALRHQFDHFLTCYIDDLLIASKSFDEHVNNLDAVFTSLQDQNYTLSLEKSLFLQKKVNFLGYVLSVDGVEPEPERLDIIKKFAVPKNKQELQSFLGVLNWYRQFSYKYSDKTAIFRELMSDKNLWVWTNEHQKAFEEIKNNFIDCTMLSHVNFDLTFYLQTDASDNGISGVLYQIDAQGNHFLISIVTRLLKSAEINYTVTEKELLAIIFSIFKFNSYLMGREFIIITDHKALEFLNRARFLNFRLIRWSLFLQCYSFTVKYCPGRDNVVADFFSRNPEGQFAKHDKKTQIIPYLHHHIADAEHPVINHLFIKSQIEDNILPEKLKNILTLQKQDKYIQNLMNSKKNVFEKYFYLYNRILFYRDKKGKYQIVIPEMLVEELTCFIHDKLGHYPGYYKTLSYIRTYYFWNKMKRDIKMFIQKCDLCQRVKVVNYEMEGRYRLVKSQCPNDLVTVDFYGPLPRSIGGVQYIFVLLDAFSKLVKVYAVKKATTNAVLKIILNKYIPEVGKPKRILSDHGSQFTSHKWRHQLESQNIEVCFSAIRHPQSNPTERVMRELGRLFRTFCSDTHTRWAKHLTQIEKIINITIHTSTGFTPWELHFGKPPINAIQTIVDFPIIHDITHAQKVDLAKRNIQIHFDYRSKRQKHMATPITLREGDLVLLKVPRLSNAIDKTTHKFFHIYEGPYKILRDLRNNSFELIDLKNNEKIIGVYNRVSLKKYTM